MSLLFLNSLGTWEVVMIFLVVLILFGSKGIPGIAKNLGRGMKEIRNASNEIKRDIQKSALEMRKDLKVEDLEDITKLDKTNDHQEGSITSSEQKTQKSSESTDKQDNQNTTST